MVAVLALHTTELEGTSNAYRSSGCPVWKHHALGAVLAAARAADVLAGCHWVLDT